SEAGSGVKVALRLTVEPLQAVLSLPKVTSKSGRISIFAISSSLTISRLQCSYSIIALYHSLADSGKTSKVLSALTSFPSESSHQNSKISSPAGVNLQASFSASQSPVLRPGGV